MSDEFLGKPYVLEDVTRFANPPPFEINFRVYERCGVTVYEDTDNPFEPKNLVPVSARDGLFAGKKVIVPGLIGDFFRVTVVELDGKLSGESDQVLTNFRYQDAAVGFPAEWTCDGLISRKALERVDFAR